MSNQDWETEKINSGYQREDEDCLEYLTYLQQTEGENE